MPDERWQRITAAVVDDVVQSAIDKQARGEKLTTDERNALDEASNMVRSEINRWQRGEPFDPANPDASDTSTPPPDQTPDATSVATDATSDDSSLQGPSLTLGPPPLVGGPTGRNDDTYPGMMPMEPLQGPSEPPPDLRNSSDMDLPSSANAAPRPASTPPPTPPPPPTALPPAVSGPRSRADDTYPGMVPSRPASSARPSAAPSSTSSPARGPASPAMPPSIAPPSLPPPPRDPWRDAGLADDTTSPEIDQGPLRSAINRAGGRATGAAVSNVARGISNINQHGYQGDDPAWRTEAHQAASAWLKQYQDAPETLDPREKRAYERDPGSLEQTILDPNSPFANYRESWIGAYRNGDLVPEAEAFDRDLRGYGGSDYQSPYPSPASPAPDVPAGGNDLLPPSPVDDAYAMPPTIGPPDHGQPDNPELAYPPDDTSQPDTSDQPELMGPDQSYDTSEPDQSDGGDAADAPADDTQTYDEGDY